MVNKLELHTCKNTSGTTGLTLGRNYHVKKRFSKNGRKYVKLVANDYGISQSYKSSRFEFYKPLNVWM